jgi:hypothetical protein
MYRITSFAAFLLVLLSSQLATADDVQLTLDLRNAISNDPLSGGTWQLFVRKLETGDGSQGDHGLASARAILENIDPASVTFRPSIGQSTTGGPYVNSLSNGTVEILYNQDLNGAVVTKVGVPNTPVPRDTLIAEGTLRWPKLDGRVSP